MIRIKKNNRSKLIVITIMALFIASVFIRLPYYITMPGSAEDVSPMVSVKGGDDSEKGVFMLTTVSMMRANPLMFLVATFKDYYDIDHESKVIPKGESKEDYNEYQLMMMTDSQQSAKVVAYKTAGKKVKYVNKGVFVIRILPDMPAVGVLKVGDQLLAVNNHPVKVSNDFIDVVSGKKEGEHIQVKIKRDGKESTVKLVVKPFKKEPKRVGIGISLAEDIKVKVTPSVKIDSENIGGPSAGLMFTLEMYGQLTKGDLTKGYNIAGTGTMDSEGKVGPIGGIDKKVVAADKEGADIFFAPNEDGRKGSNYKIAVKTAKEIGSKMKIVPVDHFEDATKYLSKLKKKRLGQK